MQQPPTAGTIAGANNLDGPKQLEQGIQGTVDLLRGDFRDLAADGFSRGCSKRHAPG